MADFEMETIMKAMFFLTIIQMAIADLETPNGIFKTNCFSDTNNEECEDSRIKICHDFYACDLVIHFASPIKRIGYIDEEVLVAEGFNTYWIDDRKMEAKKVKKVIPPLNEYVDNKGNKYYSGEGTTYVSHKESGKEIEIVTTGEYSFNQLALDKESNLLFILTFPPGNKERRDGKLYGVVLDPLNITDDKIQADMVEGNNNITALAVAGGLDKLLLGIKTDKGGKLVRLSRQVEDPCVVLKSPQNEIIKVVKDTEKKLLQIFEENLIALNVRHTDFEKDKHTLKELNEQNNKCQAQLQQLQDFRFRLSSFSESIAVANSFLAESTVDRNYSDGFVQKSHGNSSNEDIEDNNFHKECLPAEDIKFMRDRIKNLQEREEELLERLRKYGRDLSEFFSPPRTSVRVGDDDEQIVFQT